MFVWRVTCNRSRYWMTHSFLEGVSSSMLSYWLCHPTFFLSSFFIFSSQIFSSHWTMSTWTVTPWSFRSNWTSVRTLMTFTQCIYSSSRCMLSWSGRSWSGQGRVVTLVTPLTHCLFSSFLLDFLLKSISFLFPLSYSHLSTFLLYAFFFSSSGDNSSLNLNWSAALFLANNSSGIPSIAGKHPARNHISNSGNLLVSTGHISIQVPLHVPLSWIFLTD